MSSREGLESSKIPKREWALLTGFMLLAFIIRLFLLRYEYVLTPDGVYYAILGKNLVSGNLKDGLSTYWPPLYPLFVGISSLIFQDLEFSGRFVSVLAGSLLVIPVYLWIRNSYGKDAASLGAFLTAVYPSLINYSTKLLTESIFTLLLMTGTLIGWHALSKGNRYLFLLTGLAFGACYLFRPEAIGYMVLMIILTSCARFFFNQLTFKRVLLNNLFLILSFAVLAFPYIFYIHQETGKWTISEKFGVHFPTLSNDSWFGLSPGDDTTRADRLWAGSRPTNESSDSGLRSKSAQGSGFNLSLAIMGIIKGVVGQYEVIIPQTFPVLFILLTAIGIFRTAWSRERAGKEVYVLLFFISTIIGYSVVWPDPRYLVPQVPILICWTAKGIIELENWFAETVKSHKLIKPIIIVAVFLSLIPNITLPMRSNKLRQPIEQKHAALWIKRHSNSAPLIMSVGPWAAFYSGGKHLYLPDEEYPVVIEYARRKKVDYIVIDERWIPKLTPRLNFLLDEESQNRELKLVYKYDEIPGNKILIFELTETPD